MARGFAAGHETSEAGELPDTLEQRAGGFQRARLGVGAGVEQAYLERADIALDGFEQGDNGALVTGVSAERLRPTAGGDDGIDMRQGFFQGTTDQADGVAAPGEAPTAAPMASPAPTIATTLRGSVVLMDWLHQGRG